jgi:7-cyano-7-deazaguanine synthase in queuosine biosynthesis
MNARLLLAFGSAVYCVDKLDCRSYAPDGWTRDLSLSIYGRGNDEWEHLRDPLQALLGFLTGDRWSLNFNLTKKKLSVPVTTAPVASDAVCLFSGGLDSLCGAIAILEQGHSVCLLSHHEGGIVASRQSSLAAALANHYGSDRVHHEQIWIGPARGHPDQSRPLPVGVREETTRSRSLLFISAGVALATALGETIPLYVPENGFIGINVPLVASRLGSLSTRTTHPHFMSGLSTILETIGFETPLINPFRLMTKGEVVSQSPNTELLSDLAKDSISCAHPQAARYAQLPQGNCGYCFPCLIRRASLFGAGWDVGSDYAFDALTNDAILDGSSDRSSDFRALLFSLSRSPSSLAVLRSGGVPKGEAGAFDDVYRRGRQEISDWLADGASKRIRMGWPVIFS